MKFCPLKAKWGKLEFRVECPTGTGWQCDVYEDGVPLAFIPKRYMSRADAKMAAQFFLNAIRVGEREYDVAMERGE
jgi:hypothetical protein